jgi:membrane protein YqaA with SNARE-associated domain
MAVESTVFPIPSEVIVLPAAYRARQGGLNFWGVVAASTPGSWFGSSLSCWFAYVVGRPLILKYGGYFGVPEKKGLLAECWIRHYSNVGLFFARLLPVVRHLISLSAGAARSTQSALAPVCRYFAPIPRAAVLYFAPILPVAPGARRVSFRGDLRTQLPIVGGVRRVSLPACTPRPPVAGGSRHVSLGACPSHAPPIAAVRRLTPSVTVARIIVASDRDAIIS